MHSHPKSHLHYHLECVENRYLPVGLPILKEYRVERATSTARGQRSSTTPLPVRSLLMLYHSYRFRALKLKVLLKKFLFFAAVFLHA